MSAPSVGRIVHFQPLSDSVIPAEPYAAIIAAVRSEDVLLAVFDPDLGPTLVAARHALHDEPTPGHWNWPPRT
ncbi:hypothetical protein [Nocardia puris]|uniref:hypothetical protein n=1 Tax=Nocardia puris TaxID=208602 RepID=UPI002E1C2B89